MSGRQIPTILRFSQCLAHPLRIELMRRLAVRPESSAMAARELGLTVSQVNFHMRRLLNDCGVLELAERRKGRGGEELFRLKPREALMPFEVAGLPVAIQVGLSGSLLEEFVSLAVPALVDPSLEEVGRVFSGGPGVVDSEGWGKAEGLFREAHAELALIEDESRERLAGRPASEGVHILAGLALLPVG